ncbi:hypothetical protein AWC14_14055 [Mycobacterium kyorinense]|uniref:Tyr recombinase domain-containing protein n=1 Tax=Mycobacterium kyorinense TaxID=487514 RepID=A0A1X1XGP5_9MYCO|nr:hypothetical protein AWC14_14055 [Mycobacterium kyorinense]
MASTHGIADSGVRHRACPAAFFGDGTYVGHHLPSQCDRHRAVSSDQSIAHTAPCASLAISSGTNVKVVQKLLGHKTAVLTLDRYGHLFPDDLAAVATAFHGAA